MQNLKPHLHRDRPRELPTNEHGVWGEMNQLWSVLARGHGTTKRCPPALCSDMAGQRGWVARVCVCVYMSECVWIYCSLTETVFLHVTVCVNQQESSHSSEWGSTRHMVRCLPRCCHGSRLPQKETGSDVGLCQGYSIPGSVKIATLMLSWWKKLYSAMCVCWDEDFRGFIQQECQAVV